MNFAPKKQMQRTVAAGLVAAALLGATGCSLVSEQATTKPYVAGDGINADIGPLDLRNILLIAPAEGKPGTLLGTVFNTSDSDVQLTIKGDSETVTITVAGDDKFVFEDKDTENGTLQGISEIPGSLVDLPMTVNSETVEVKIPVLDGTFERYREFVPGGYTPPAEPTSPAVEEEGE